MRCERPVGFPSRYKQLADKVAPTHTRRPGSERTLSISCSGEQVGQATETSRAEKARKLLTRNTFAKSTEDHDEETPIPTSKAEILNLISVDVDATAELGFSFINIFRSVAEMLVGASYVWVLLG